MARRPLNTRDHFVPVTYLRHFGDPSQSDRLHVCRKRSGSVSISRPENLCVERQGDLNRYFSQPSILREFLEIIEPRWNETVDHILSDRASPDDLFVVAGIAAYLLSCTPTARRLGQRALEQQLEAMRPMIARHARETIDDPEEASLVEEGLLATDTIRINVDDQYPRAIGISNLVAMQARLLQGHWQVIKNENEKPLITSDYPACHYHSTQNSVLGLIYFPLTPTYAVMNKPSLERPENPVTPQELELGSVTFSTFITLASDVAVMGGKIK